MEVNVIFGLGIIAVVAVIVLVLYSQWKDDPCYNTMAERENTVRQRLADLCKARLDARRNKNRPNGEAEVISVSGSDFYLVVMIDKRLIGKPPRITAVYNSLDPNSRTVHAWCLSSTRNYNKLLETLDGLLAKGKVQCI